MPCIGVQRSSAEAAPTIDATFDAARAHPPRIRRCVFTVLTGRYERLNEQPVARDSSLPFICLTDTPDVTSETWQIRPLLPMFSGDPVRSQRAVKLRPHQYLPEFDASLYIDNTVLLAAPPERLFEAVDLTSGISLPHHSYRDTVLEEFAAVSADGIDDPQRLAEQLAHYQAAHPDILGARPFWAGMILRDHRNPVMVAAMDIWFAHLCRYSRRDQLSANLAFQVAGVKPDILELDSFGSQFHTWPHLSDRRTDVRTWHAEPVPDPVALLRDQRLTRLADRTRTLEDALHDLQHRHDAISTATTWRVMAPVRVLGRLLRGAR